MCVTGCPYKKVYFNHRTGKAEKCTFCYPAGRGPPAHRVLGDLRGAAA
jgi:nitrate reductase beta subunit